MDNTEKKMETKMELSFTGSLRVREVILTVKKSEKKADKVFGDVVLH